MNFQKKLFRNNNVKAGSYYLIGNLFNKAIVFLTIPIFTRLMSTSDYGIYNTYMSWVSIFSLIVGLSLGNSIRNAFVDFREDIEEFISSIFFLSVVNFLISSTFIILFSYYFIEQLDLILVVLCLVQSFMLFVTNTISIKYMMEVNYLKRALLLALPNIVISIFSVVVLITIKDDKYLGRIIPSVIVSLVIGSYYLASYFIKGKKLVDFQYWKYALTLSLPLIFHGLSVIVLATSDRTMITVFRSPSETGIYSLVYSLTMVSTVVTTSLESVWIPWFTKKMEVEDKDSINKMVGYYIEIAMVVMIVILMIGPEILMLMAPKEYWSGKYIIPPILLASFLIFLYSISVDLEYYYKSTKIIAINTIIAATTNFGLNMLLIPKYGSIAAAYTTVTSYIISFCIHYRAARKLDSDLFHPKIYFKPFFVMFVSVLLAYLFMDLILIRWSVAVIVLILYLYQLYKHQRFNLLFG